MWIREAVTAAKALLRRPGFVTVVAATLALGIGANVAIFTVVDAVLLRPLPYPESERIVEIRHHAPGLDLDELRNSTGTAAFYRDLGGRIFESFALVDDARANLTGVGAAERVDVAWVTPDLFEVLRTEPALGRSFTEAEGREGAPRVAILTHAAWQSRFGGDRSVLGRTVRVDGVATEIVGVMPEGFRYPEAGTVALLPLQVGEPVFGTFGRVGLARLAPGIGVERARAETVALQPRLAEYFESLTPEFLERARWTASVDPLRDRAVGGVRATLWVILGTVAFVLLIACANVANLVLVRAEGRRREVAVRAALGAGRRHLAAAFLGEGVLLGVLGGVLGSVLAWIGVGVLVRLGPAALPRLHEISVGPRALVYAAGVSLLAGVALGMVPAFRHLGRSFAAILREGGRPATAGRGRVRARNVLVVAQLSLALVLLVGSGLMLRTFHRLRTVEVGIDPSGVLAVGMSVGAGRDEPAAAAFYAGVLERVRALPGVVSAGAANSIPLLPAGINGGSFYIRSRPRAEDDLPPVAMNVIVTPGHLESLDLPVLRGRAPTEADRAGRAGADREGGAQAVWVNRAFADRFLGGDLDAALGEHVGAEEEGPWAEIVGVVGDVRHFRLREEVRPLIYQPIGSVFSDRGAIHGMTLTIETDGEPTALAGAVRRIVAEVDPTVPITTVRTMEEVVAESMADTSFAMILLGLSAALALLLGAVGIYGVVSYVVSQRTREIGVRMALGARATDVRTMVVRQGMRVAGVGVVVGMAAALVLTRWMGELLFEVPAADPVTFVAVAAVLFGVAALAVWLPARRATRVDPVVALASE